jgi:hypothetical protein
VLTYSRILLLINLGEIHVRYSTLNGHRLGTVLEGSNFAQGYGKGGFIGGRK